MFAETRFFLNGIVNLDKGNKCGQFSEKALFFTKKILRSKIKAFNLNYIVGIVHELI